MWTEASEAAFEDIKMGIHECPRLDDVSLIYVLTNASDYGIGAYMFQRVLQTIETPIHSLAAPKK